MTFAGSIVVIVAFTESIVVDVAVSELTVVVPFYEPIGRRIARVALVLCERPRTERPTTGGQNVRYVSTDRMPSHE